MSFRHTIYHPSQHHFQVTLAYEAQTFAKDGYQNASALVAYYDVQPFITDSYPSGIILYFNRRPTAMHTTTHGGQPNIRNDASVLEVCHNSHPTTTAATFQGKTLFTGRYPSALRVSYNVPSTAAQTFITNGSNTFDTSTFTMCRMYYAVPYSTDNPKLYYYVPPTTTAPYEDQPPFTHGYDSREEGSGLSTFVNNAVGVPSTSTITTSPPYHAVPPSIGPPITQSSTSASLPFPSLSNNPKSFCNKNGHHIKVIKDDIEDKEANKHLVSLGDKRYQCIGPRCPRHPDTANIGCQKTCSLNICNEIKTTGMENARVHLREHYGKHQRFCCHTCGAKFRRLADAMSHPRTREGAGVLQSGLYTRATYDGTWQGVNINPSGRPEI